MSANTDDTNVSREAEQLVDRLDEDVDIETSEVVDVMEDFISFGVTGSQELQNATISKLGDRHDLERDELVAESGDGGTADIVEVSSISEEGDWVTIVAEVVDLWEPNSDSIQQVGLLDDGTGTIKFTSWKKSDAPTVEEGMVYMFENVVTSEYDGNYSVQVNSNSDITASDQDIQTSGEEVEFEGFVVDVQDRSGLIARDEDGQVVDPSNADEYEDDLRLMVVIDNGDELYTAVLNRELTEEFTGINLEEAKEMAVEAIDRDVVRGEMKPLIMGEYLTVRGPRMGRYINVDEYDEGVSPPSVDELLVKARAMTE
jgi:replication factor A1